MTTYLMFFACIYIFRIFEFPTKIWPMLKKAKIYMDTKNRLIELNTDQLEEILLEEANTQEAIIEQ